MTIFKYKFSRKEICLLSGLTLQQLRILQRREIIIPQKTPIRYSWQQLIYCAVFSYLRKEFSWEDSVKYLSGYKNWIARNRVNESVNLLVDSGDVLIVQHEYGVLVECYSQQKDIDVFLKNNIVKEILIDTPVNIMLLPREEKVVNNIIMYEYDNKFADKTVKIYICNIVNDFYNIANKNNLITFENKAELPLLKTA
jgi:hypothetical protein